MLNFEEVKIDEYAARPSSRTTFVIVVRFVVRVDERNEVASSIGWPSKRGS